MRKIYSLSARLLCSLLLSMFLFLGATPVMGENVSWNLVYGSTTCSSASADEVVFSSDYATVSITKNGGTNANNYLGTGSGSKTHSRFYSNNIVTFTPADGYKITSAVVECDGNYTAYWTTKANQTNCETSVSNNNVTITPTNQRIAFSIKLTGTTRVKTITVYYESATSSVSYTVAFDAGTKGELTSDQMWDDGTTNKRTEASAGAGVTLPNVTTINSDFEFAGWSTSSNPSSANAGAAGATFKPTQNCTLYAYYTMKIPSYSGSYVDFDLSTNSVASASDDALTWTSNYVDISDTRKSGGTAANNYYPGTSGKSYTSTRFYKDATVTFTPKTGVTLTGIVYTATSNDYTSAWANSAWTNGVAVADADNKTAYITPTDGTSAVSGVMSNTTGATKIRVYYTEAAKYDVTFDLQGHGSAIAKQSLIEGAKVTRPTDPEVNGYTFGGWYKEPACTNEWNFDTDVVGTEAIVLYAKWTLINYNITYNNVTAEEHSNPATYTIETATINLSDANRDGFVFLGWYDSNDTKVLSIAQGSYGDKAFSAKWQVIPTNPCTVTFNVGEHGTCDVTELTEESVGAGVDLPAVTANDGWVFKGWSTSNPASAETLVSAGDDGKYHIAVNTPLYACYKIKPATPTFSSATGAIEKGTEVTISCTTEGATIYYTANGDVPTASSTSYSTAIAVNAEQTLKAIAILNGEQSEVASVAYTIATHTAQFSINGVITDGNNSIVAKGEAISFPSNPADIDDLKFQGWTKTQNYSNATDAPSDLCTSATMETADVTFYAVYANVEDGKDGDIITLDYKNVHSAYTTDGVDREMQKIDGFMYYGCMQGKESGATVASILQMRKTSNDVPTSWIYNSTEINFSKVVITYMSNNNKLCNVFFGSEANPTTGAVTCDGTADAAGTNTFTNANKAKYFRIENPKNGAIYISSIKIHTVSAPVCTNYCTKVRESITLTYPEGGDYGFSTFCGSANYTVEGADAYKASVVSDKLVLTKLEGVIPAGNSEFENGVVIAGTPGKTATIHYTTKGADADMSGNQLLGTLAVTPAADLKGNATYLMVFSKSNGGFVSYTGEYVPAYKACLPYHNDNASAPMRMVFGRDNLPTNNVNVNVNDNQGTKVMIDGRLYILRDGKTYDSFGRLVK